MAVGEIFLAAFLQALFEKLLSPELLQFARRYEGLGETLGKWKKTLSRIEAVLDDAEEKQHTNRAVKQWVDDLRDLAYDVEDILDDFATDALLRKLRGENQASTSRVRNLIPACCTGFTPHALQMTIRLESNITEITDRFNDLMRQEVDLRLIAYGISRRRTGTLVAGCVMIEPHVYGRDKDKEALLELLLSEEGRDAPIPTVIPILGMGGIGKTTLARFLFNDEKVKSLFDLKAWACVSADFDGDRVTKSILHSLNVENCDGKDLNWLQVKLKEKLEGKKYLVILDDLWNENFDDWTILRAPFLAGSRGSTIIITTRNNNVAAITGTVPTHLLKVLSHDDCLSLFTQHALGADGFSAHPNIQDIGEEIVKRCKGLPLAAKTLGGLLRTKHNRDEWNNVLQSKIWNIPEEQSKIVPALMLSYHHLPSHLKRCFAYCSILPNDYEFKEQQLVLLWMAEGLIQSHENDKQMEVLGSEYFHDLLSRSFFQQSSMKKSRFVMHDLINDLAQCVAGDTCFRLEDRIGGSHGQRLPETARHSSYLVGKYDSNTKFEAFFELTRLRTFLSFKLPTSYYCYLTHSVPLQLLPKLKCLRVLSFNGYFIYELPDSIGDLKHLRYLDLSHTRIKDLPESTTTLCNLQTLILKNCYYLKELPSKLRNLVNLRHLNILNADKLEGMPPQIGKLTSLQTLSNLIVGKGNCFALKELGYLLHLQGTLIISRLENTIEPRDASDARLIEKPALNALCLEWSVDVDGSQDRTSELDVLNMLHPNKSLKELTIRRYGGIEFTTWLKGPSFPNMVLLRIENCKKCTLLPPIGQLPSLKDLFIEGMDSVKSVGDEFYGGSCSQAFRSLETLCFNYMKEWENWSPNGEFLHLRELSIKNCPKLLGKLPNCLPLLQNVVIKSCEQLVVPISSFPKLCKFEIEGSKGVVYESKVDFTSLNFKSLSTISKFNCPVEGFMNVEDLTIVNCKELMPLWSNDVGLLQPLPRLRKMQVYRCQKLVSLMAEEVKELFLENIYIDGCDSLTHVAIEQLPPTLKSLSICNCKMLESVTKTFHHSSSLEAIYIGNCENLKSLPRGIHSLSHLQHIYIRRCSTLVSFPDGGLLPCNLRTLLIEECENMQALPNCIHNITSLQELKIEKCPGIVSFPDEGFSTNLTSLTITDCNITEALLAWGLHRLTSLQHLQIRGGCPHLVSFQEVMLPASLTSLLIRNFPNLEDLSFKGLRYLSSLTTLKIGWCEKLMSFPDDGLPPSLLHLRIVCCEKFTSFPENGLPPSLQQLHIANCPLLRERDWIKIAYIPRVEIDGRFIYDPETEEENPPMDQDRLESLFYYYS
jgi:hypothetical protein